MSFTFITFIALISLLCFSSAIFFKLNPLTEIKAHKPALNYFLIFYLSQAIAFVLIPLNLSLPFNLSIYLTNCLFVLSAYALKYGLLSRAKKIKQHIHKDRIVLLNVFAIALVSHYSYYYLDNAMVLRILVVDLNMAAVFVSCVQHVSTDRNSKGEKIMKGALWMGAFLAAITWIPLFVTGDRDMHILSVLFNESLLVLIFLGALLSLLLSDVISMHYRNSVTDPMTKLFNRRYFLSQLKNMISSSKRYNVAASIIMCDIDKFKLVNDAYGHDIGDIVIREFADILNSNARNNDIVARIGGEEFVILLPQETVEGAAMLANRIRTDFEQKAIYVDNACISCTASFGVSAVDPNRSIDLNFKDVDKALYKAKNSGRNQVRY